MIRIVFAPWSVELPSPEEARDFLILLTGAQRLTRVERTGVRHLRSAATAPKTLEDVAARHAAEPVVLAPPPPAPSEVRVRVTPTRPRNTTSPLIAHVLEAPTPPVVEPAPAKRRGRPPTTPKVAPGELTATRVPVRGAEPEPTPERSKGAELLDRIVAAFAADSAYPLPKLAAELFGEATGRAVQKTRLLIEQLVARHQLERLGVATFRVAAVAREDGPEELRDQVDDDEVEDARELGFG